MRIVTAAEMKRVDELAASQRGIPVEALMETAGGAVFEELARQHPDPARSPALAALCGRGNNGGDGLVAARRWLTSGRTTTVFLCSTRETLPALPALMLKRYLATGGRLIELTDERAFQKALPQFLDCGLLLDALHGAGLDRPLEGFSARLIDTLQMEYTGRVVALDLPSGLAADEDHPVGSFLRAHQTLAIGALKPCHVLEPARAGCGAITRLDIGLPLDLLPQRPALHTIEPARLALALRPRQRTAHKGQFGHLLVIAGSRGKSGAAALAGLAALRAGAGLVTVATPAAVAAEVASHAPELMTLPLPCGEDGAVTAASAGAALAAAEACDAVVCGPGLGTGAGAMSMLTALLAGMRQPLLLDADALTLCADHPNALRAAQPPLLITPHPGEAGRLLGLASREAARRRLALAPQLAAKTGALTVYKGSGTLVATPEGETWINTTGNPGMATAGAGDVLAGIIGALLARKVEPLDAALLGVHWHGLAGDLAAEQFGEEPLIAGDLVAALPAALKAMRAG